MKLKNKSKNTKRIAPVVRKSTKTGKKGKSAGEGRYLGGRLLAKMARGGAASLRENAEEVNQLNVFPVPDGDTGDNMSMTLDSGVDAIENIESDDISDVISALSHGMLMGARGNSGVILSQFFAGMASSLGSARNANPKILGIALKEGVKRAYTTVSTPREGTILTVAREAVDYACDRLNEGSTITSFFNDLTGEMKRSLKHTPELLPVLAEAGVVDSGGAGLLYIMEGFNRVLNGEEPPDVAVRGRKTQPINTKGFGPDSKMTYGYCTELLVQLMNDRCNIDAYDIFELREFLNSVGDSVVAFKTDSIVKLHVHTERPEAVLERLRQVGEFITVKIENMTLQHSSIIESTGGEISEKNQETPDTVSKKPQKKPYGIVAVSSGEGISSLMRDLGADEIIEGGSGKNPGTCDFTSAYDRINAESIFVFPNNSNIILAANMSAELYEAAHVYVIPTADMGGGYVALSTIDLTCDDPKLIVKNALKAAEGAVCAYISPAIRDAELFGISIKAGNTIGIIGKEIVVSEPDEVDCAYRLIDKLVPEKYMLTVFCGRGAVGERTAELEKYIRENYPDRELYIIDGGQDIYPYIFIAE